MCSLARIPCLSAWTHCQSHHSTTLYFCISVGTAAGATTAVAACDCAAFSFAPPAGVPLFYVPSNGSAVTLAHPVGAPGVAKSGAYLLGVPPADVTASLVFVAGHQYVEPSFLPANLPATSNGVAVRSKSSALVSSVGSTSSAGARNGVPPADGTTGNSYEKRGCHGGAEVGRGHLSHKRVGRFRLTWTVIGWPSAYGT